MERRAISDRGGQFIAELEVQGPVLRNALSHPHAEDVIKASIISALIALTQDGPWPVAFIETTRSFMQDVRDAMHANELH